MSRYFIPDNLVVRVCAVFDGKKLQEIDYFRSKDYDLKYLLESLDKEYAYKSLIMKVVQEGVLHNCCPLHVNAGLCEIMQIIRARFSVGKGNVNFGSTFYCDDPSRIENYEDIIQHMKDSGTVIVVAKEFENRSYVDALMSHKIIPLMIGNADVKSLEPDDYILLKDIRKHIINRDMIEAFCIHQKKGITPITLKLVDGDKNNLNNLLD